jgi:hypothetical protein
LLVLHSQQVCQQKLLLLGHKPLLMQQCKGLMLLVPLPLGLQQQKLLMTHKERLEKALEELVVLVVEI